MIGAKDAVVWVNHDTKEVMVKSHAWGTTAYGFACTRGDGVIRSARPTRNGRR
jgi:hypothetical protein